MSDTVITRPLIQTLYMAIDTAATLEDTQRAIDEYEAAGLSMTPHDFEHRDMRAECIATLKRFLREASRALELRGGHA